MTIDKARLKALAEAATPGPWECREAEGSAAICHKHGWVADDFSEQTVFDTRYMAAANPVTVLALLAELEEDVMHLRVFAQVGDSLAAECDQLKAEIARSTEREIHQLAEIEGLRKALEDCADSLHAEMLQKLHGELPENMHPVTRREYDRDMAELAGYRALLSKEPSQ
jgi:hypothetical protein